MRLYCLQVDPNGQGKIEAMDAARFLKKSQLSDVILSKIWDMADPQSRGSLDKSGLFVALKLCALAQSGQDLNMSNLNLELPPPKMVSSLYMNICNYTKHCLHGASHLVLGRYPCYPTEDYH